MTRVTKPHFNDLTAFFGHDGEVQVLLLNAVELDSQKAAGRVWFLTALPHHTDAQIE